MANERDELEAYREKVVEELKARAQKLKGIDSALSSTEYLISSAGTGRGLRSGNTLHILAGASHKGHLKRELERLERQRREAAADLKRAEERLADVDLEISKLEQGDDSAPGNDEGGS